MANRRLLVKRRKAVRNIRKITRTMQLIATARFQAAFNRATATKPYTEKLTELADDLSRAAGDVDHPLMREPEDVQRSSLVTISSMRGLCGGYNASMLRSAVKHLDEQKEHGIETDITMVGKKGISYFKFLKRPMVAQITHLGDKPSFEDVEPIANALMDRFTKGEIRSVYVSYVKFISAAKQQPVVVRILPLSKEDSTTEAGESKASLDYEFSPAPKELLDELLPATVRARLFQCFTDAIVSEQIARMVAMKAATDASEDMIKLLTQKYNRARQTAITMELLDIVSGSNALK